MDKLAILIMETICPDFVFEILKERNSNSNSKVVIAQKFIEKQIFENKVSIDIRDVYNDLTFSRKKCFFNNKLMFTDNCFFPNKASLSLITRFS